MVGRYPLRSAWAYKVSVGQSRNISVTGNLAMPKTSSMATLNKRRAGTTAGATIWRNWWLGSDRITAKTTYDSGLLTLKRWTGSQWVAAKLKIKKF